MLYGRQIFDLQESSCIEYVYIYTFSDIFLCQVPMFDRWIICICVRWWYVILPCIVILILKYSSTKCLLMGENQNKRDGRGTRYVIGYFLPYICANITYLPPWLYRLCTPGTRPADDSISDHPSLNLQDRGTSETSPILAGRLSSHTLMLSTLTDGPPV